MCGRFTLTANPEDIRDAFPDIYVPEQMSPHFNIAPTQPLAVIPNDGQNQVDFFTWGLVPSWAKDPAIGSRMINARGETLAEKPSFRTAYRRRRCLILADGFYEWKKETGKKVKTPYYIYLTHRKPFAFAGLWEQWFSPDGSEIKSAAIITTEPNDKIRALHNRMPVILPREAYPRWLDPRERTRDELQDLLTAYPAEKMAFHVVSRTVNSPANDLPVCIDPVGPVQNGLF